MWRSTRKWSPAHFDQQEPVGRQKAVGQAPSSSEELSTGQEISFGDLITSQSAAPEVHVTAFGNSAVSFDTDAALEQPTIGSSWYSSVFLVVNAALGAGLLHFPQAYHQAGGITIAVLIQAILLVFIVAGLLILASCSHKTGGTTYQDVVRTNCGLNAQRACAVFLVLYCFSTDITYLIVIGDQWEEFFLFAARKLYCETPQPWYMGRTSTITITSIILILPMCFPKRIDFLKYVSFVGVIGIFYVVCMIAIKYFLPHDEPGPIKTKPDTWMDVFNVVPAICFSYQCHDCVPPIFACMEHRNLKQFSKTVSLAMIICVATYTVTAVFGYLTFGDDVTSDVLLSYDPDVFVIIAVILIAVKSLTAYPILFFCGREAFESLWTDLRGLSASVIVEQERLRRFVITPIWFAVTLVSAIFIPNIGIAISFLGALAAVFIFIFPGMCLIASTMRTVKESYWTGRRRLAVGFSCCFITVGALVFGLTLAKSIMNITSGDNTLIKADKSQYTC